MSSRASSWEILPADAALVAQLQTELKLSQPVARVVASRFATVDQARRHLEPKLARLSSPSGMAGLDVAVDRIANAISKGELVGIFGDYDADGVTSTAILADYLQRCGARLRVRVARRDEGYGFRVCQAEEMIAGGCTLLVLTDCGTSDHEAVALVAGAGIDVIAVDHHRVGQQKRWPGLALVNPQQQGCAFADKTLCSAGLAFYLIASLRRRLERDGKTPPDPREALDLVALGTVADVAPLMGNNRILVAKGLQQLARTERPGLRELLKIADLRGRLPRAEDVAWRLAPRLNAPGRLGDASVALDCLRQRDESAVAIAQRCNLLNEERKALQQRILEEATEQAGQRQGDSFCLVAGDDWHPGVNGIVAARLAETLQRPAAVVSWEGDRGRASARSVPGVDLFAVLSTCGDRMERFGGHAAAAGFTINRSQLEPLRGALCSAADEALGALLVQPLKIDAEVTFGEVDRDLLSQLRRLEPYGEENPSPVFMTRNTKVEAVRLMGESEEHMSLALRQDRAVRQAVGFGLADRRPQVGDSVDVAFVPTVDEYYGPRLRLRLVDLKQAERGERDERS